MSRVSSNVILYKLIKIIDLKFYIIILFYLSLSSHKVYITSKTSIITLNGSVASSLWRLVFQFFIFHPIYKWSSWSWSHGSWIYNYLCNQCPSPLKLWVLTLFMARCTQYNIMWLATGQWFSPGTPVSSTNKTDGHDKTEILLKATFNIITLTHPFIKFKKNINILPLQLYRVHSTIIIVLPLQLYRVHSTIIIVLS